MLRAFTDPKAAPLLKSPDLWFAACIPLIPIILGLAGLLNARGKRDQPISGPPTAAAASLETEDAFAGPLVLGHSGSRGRQFISASIVTLVFNGLLLTFWLIIMGQVAPWKVSEAGLELVVWFLFGLVGLGLACLSLRFLLILFNPRPVLTVERPAVPLGEPLALAWSMDGRVDRLKRLQLWLEGRELATYRRGTDTLTDANVFARFNIADTTAQMDIRSDSATIALPLDSVPSFEAPNNKIEWVIRMHGEIPHWPDLSETWPFKLLPARSSAALSSSSS